MSAYAALISAIVFLPALGALVIGLFVPKDKPELIRLVSLASTVVVLALTIWLILPSADPQASIRFRAGVSEMQGVFNYAWIPTFNIDYFMGLDGISFPLLLLTSFISVLAMWASWPIEKHVKAYCILYLLLETGMLGVFVSLDFFLFYVFWEVMLLPMYFLIGIWGGPRREYAAIKFFLYTLLGSVLMLIAILMLYFSSDLRELARLSDFEGPNPNAKFAWDDLHLHPRVDAQLGRTQTRPQDRPNAAILFYRSPVEAQRPLRVDFEPAPSGTEGVTANYDAARNTLTVHLAKNPSAAEVVAALAQAPDAARLFRPALAPGSNGSDAVLAGDDVILPAFNPQAEVHTFNLLALMKMGQHTDLFNPPGEPLLFGWSLQIWAFLLLFIGFAIKVPVVPVHTWLPDAHVEAPTPISMILAGILLKMGGYGIIRICYPICPEGGFELRWVVCAIGAISMVYGAFAAMAQKDFKRLVAYSSVSHMGYVVLGLGVWSAIYETGYNPNNWALGANGAMFQMIAHGISSPGMFFLVGVVYDRVHHRNLDEFGGLFHKMPVYAGVSIGIFFAALGLPGLCGFIGEVFVVLSVWNFSQGLAILSAAVVILTAGYILWTIQRVYLGAEYKGPHPEALTPMTLRERLIVAPLLALAILLGVYPTAVFQYMSDSVNQTINDMAAWTKENYPGPGVLTDAVSMNEE